MAVMDRRELLQLGVAALAAGSFTERGLAQSATPVAAATPKKIRIDAYSRTLHWLRTPEQVAEACHQIGNTTIDLTVRTYPGHVQPDKVKTDLPVFVKALEKNGITVTSIAADINDAKTPFVEDILGTMNALGIRHHWWRGMGGFDNTKPYGPQIEALETAAGRARNARREVRDQGDVSPAGRAVLRLPRARQELRFEIRQPPLRHGPLDAGVAVEHGVDDHVGRAVRRRIRLEGRSGRESGSGASSSGGRARRERLQPASTRPPRCRAGAPAAAVVGRGGRSGGGDLSMASALGRCRSARAWSISRWPPARSRTINFDGPTECQPEWTGLGGAESGRDTLTLPRETVIGLLKRDYETIHAALVAAGVA